MSNMISLIYLQKEFVPFPPVRALSLPGLLQLYTAVWLGMLRMLGTRRVSLLHLFSPPEQIAKVAQSQNFSGKCLMGEAQPYAAASGEGQVLKPIRQRGRCAHLWWLPKQRIQTSLHPRNIPVPGQGCPGCSRSCCCGATSPFIFPFPALSSLSFSLFISFPTRLFTSPYPASPFPTAPPTPALAISAPLSPCARHCCAGQSTHGHARSQSPPALKASRAASPPARAAAQGAEWRFFNCLGFLNYCYFSRCMEGPSRPACSGDCLQLRTFQGANVREPPRTQAWAVPGVPHAEPCSSLALARNSPPCKRALGSSEYQRPQKTMISLCLDPLKI